MQKFLRGHRVRIQSEAPPYMAHFKGFGHEAIVDHSYRDAHGGSGPVEYALLILPELRWSAWYPECFLTLVNSDRDAGEATLQKYNESRQ